jgi:hypothetical protein
LLRDGKLLQLHLRGDVVRDMKGTEN